MKSPPNSTAKNCLDGLDAYGDASALGCNATADPDNPLHDGKDRPIGPLLEYCRTWPTPCKSAIDHLSGCAAPDVRFDGAMTPPQNAVNGTQQAACIACTESQSALLGSAGCGIADLAAFCWAKYPMLPGTEPAGPPNPPPGPPGPPAVVRPIHHSLAYKQHAALQTDHQSVSGIQPARKCAANWHTTCKLCTAKAIIR
eukprot:SAG22_NODE_157_length_16986_cov_17.230177_16_plen_199_part_00